MACCLSAAIAASPAIAHDVELTRVSATFRQNGDYQVDLYYDVNAWLLGLPPQHLRPDDIRRVDSLPTEHTRRRLAELRGFVERGVRIRFDDEKYIPTVGFVENPERPTSQAEPGALLRIVRLTGRVPPTAKCFDFWASKSFGNIVLMISHESREGVVQQLLERGERSRPFELQLSQSENRWAVARQYFRLGYHHILPDGQDHILFVLGLFLLSTQLGPLLWQITAFTVAHTLTLALSTYGVVTLSPRVVEPLIALSIACVAVENVLTSKLHPWRPVVVFAFGLLHGLGFAGVLTALGLPRSQFATALVSFNVGVELGQLSVIAMAWLVVGWFRRRNWYRRRIVIPGSLVVALVGIYWTIARVLA